MKKYVPDEKFPNVFHIAPNTMREDAPEHVPEKAPKSTRERMFYNRRWHLLPALGITGLFLVGVTAAFHQENAEGAEKVTPQHYPCQDAPITRTLGVYAATGQAISLMNLPKENTDQLNDEIVTESDTAQREYERSVDLVDTQNYAHVCVTHDSPKEGEWDVTITVKEGAVAPSSAVSIPQN